MKQSRYSKLNIKSMPESKHSLEDAFVDYLESHKRLLLKVASAYCPDSIERQDLVQDMVLQLWKAFPKYDGSRGSSSTWTYRIALNVAISHLRKARTRRQAQQQYGQLQPLLEWHDSQLDERLEHLYRCMEKLKPVDKAILILHLEGLKNKEVAHIMGMSPTAISTRMQRIKAKLKKHLISSNA